MSVLQSWLGERYTLFSSSVESKEEYLQKTPISIIVPLHHCLHKPKNARGKNLQVLQKPNRKRGRKKEGGKTGKKK